MLSSKAILEVAYMLFGSRLGKDVDESAAVVEAARA